MTDPGSRNALDSAIEDFRGERLKMARQLGDDAAAEFTSEAVNFLIVLTARARRVREGSQPSRGRMLIARLRRADDDAP